MGSPRPPATGPGNLEPGRSQARRGTPVPPPFGARRLLRLEDLYSSLCGTHLRIPGLPTPLSTNLPARPRPWIEARANPADIAHEPVALLAGIALALRSGWLRSCAPGAAAAHAANTNLSSGEACRAVQETETCRRARHRVLRR